MTPSLKALKEKIRGLDDDQREGLRKAIGSETANVDLLWDDLECYLEKRTEARNWARSERGNLLNMSQAADTPAKARTYRAQARPVQIFESALREVQRVFACPSAMTGPEDAELSSE